ncbi:MAG: sensor histidine kinase [Desulfobacteraceae bacterium]|nr:MAG: sensor histidine kinase [Desulfobacteraceae bacterium]
MHLFPFRRLRTGILSTLIILIVSAMLLVNAILIKAAETDLTSGRILAGRLLLHVLSQTVQNDKYLSPSRDLLKNIEHSLHLAGFTGALLSSSETGPQLEIGEWGNALEEARASALEARATGNQTQRFFGTGWGVIWFAPERLIMSSPIASSGDKTAVLTVGTKLESIYLSLRHTQKSFLIYLALYASFLVLIGMYLFSRVVVAPVRRLLSMAAGIEDIKSAAPLPDPANNEIGQLFLAVREILAHLEENKARLKDHITSLERANQELKKARDEMLRSEKLASVGRLAAGVAHEIGNPLGIVTGYLDLIKTGVLKDEERTDLLCRIEDEMGRISRTIRQMLDLARPSHPRIEKVSIHEVILDTLEFLSGQPWLARIELRTHLKAETDLVFADIEEIREVLINIILNAADAIKTEGVITIETSGEKDLIIIKICDSGPGIPREHLLKVFDPFFTTKEPGEGTGLGLWVCYRIITAMGGRIEALRPDTGGTAIIVELEIAGPRSGHAGAGDNNHKDI